MHWKLQLAGILTAGMALSGSATASTGVEFATNDSVLLVLWDQAESGMAMGLGSADPEMRWWALHSNLATGQDIDGVRAAIEGPWEGVGRLYWPGLVLSYYRYTGDRDAVRRMTEMRMASMLDIPESHIDEDGLVYGYPAPADGPATRTPGASLNLLYWSALKAAVELTELLELDAGPYGDTALALEARIREQFAGAEDGLLRAVGGTGAPDITANVFAAALGFSLRDDADPLAPVREAASPPSAELTPWVADACYRSGDAGLGYRVLAYAAQAGGLEPESAGKFLIARHVMGFEPMVAGWPVIRFSPGLPAESGETRLRIAVPMGHVEATYTADGGYTLRLPPGASLQTNLAEDVPLEATRDEAMAMSELSMEQQTYLNEYGWAERVGDARAAWVSVDEQMLRVIEGGAILFETRCGTAEAGTGSQSGSNKTPLGWHSVSEKFGEGAPWGQVFRARQATNEIWQPGDDTKEDLVLTRVLWLDGEEPGKNKGGDVDSKMRYIYIHGTNGEQRIGEPSSHGCIRLRNDDVLVVFDMLPVGAPVLITEQE